MEYSFDGALQRLDDRLFGYVPSETSIQDRRSLLALHNVVRDHYGTFSYLEIGSHLGGSLQVALADPRCTTVTSIDSRPEWVQDEQRDPIPYPENTTERMVRYLGFVPGADLSKLHTVEASTEALSPSEFVAQLCLVDGEHTVDAAGRDAAFCRAAMRNEGVIAFHDRDLVRRAIDAFVAELDVEYESYPLPNALWVVSLGLSFQDRIQELLAPFGQRFARAGRARV